MHFRLPGGKRLRRTTGQRDRQAAESVARALVEREARRWVRQEELWSSADPHTLEQALADHRAARAAEGWSDATLDIDRQNACYLLELLDGRRLVRELTGTEIAAYVEAELGAGLTRHTVSKRLVTLHAALERARGRDGSDGRRLLATLPSPWPLVRSDYDAGEWGRALSADEWELLRLALPRGPVVDQRLWCEIATWGCLHSSDVNRFTPECVRLEEATFLWRNTKNRRRTGGKVCEEWRELPPELADELEQHQARGGWQPGRPIAGVWDSGNRHRDLRAACRRAGIASVTDHRGRVHWLSANDLRRTGATWLAEELAESGSGPDRSATEVIADWLGHRSLKTARLIYDRAIGARLERASAAWRRRAARRTGAPNLGRGRKAG